MDENKQQAPKRARPRLSEEQKAERARRREQMRQRVENRNSEPASPPPRKPKAKKGKHKKKKLTWLMWSLIAVMVLTASAMGYIFLTNNQAQSAIQENGQSLLKEYDPKTFAENEKAHATSSKDDKGKVTDERQTAYKKENDVSYNAPVQNLRSEDIDVDQQKKVAQKLQGVTRGRIQAPSINLDLPLFDGFSEDKLLVGAGTLKPNQSLKGTKNFAVAGHNTHTWRPVLFAQVPKLQKGAIVTVSYHNVVAKYKVTSTEVIPPTAVDRIEDTEAKKAKKPLLSLITCTDDSRNRYLIKGVQVSKTVY